MLPQQCPIAPAINPRQLEKGLEPFRQIRDAVGMRMEIAVELHSCWNLPAAIRIAEALEEIKPLWCRGRRRSAP